MNNIISIEKLPFKVVLQGVKMKLKVEEGWRGKDGTIRFIFIHKEYW